MPDPNTGAACEDCGHAFVNGEVGRFAQDDPEPGSGFWLCEDCWDAAEREQAAAAEEREKGLSSANAS